MNGKTSEDQNQDDRIAALEKSQLEILDLLRPIAETYTTVRTLGKWMMAFVVFISIILSVIAGLKAFLK